MVNNKVHCQKYLDQVIKLSKKNKYTKWYISICKKAALRGTDRRKVKSNIGYIESHHVLPKSFNIGGKKDVNNLVHLKAKEHFIVHILLTKMVDGIFKESMLQAAMRMSNSKHHSGKISSKSYVKTREEFSKAMSLKFKGKPSPMTPAKILANEKRRGSTNSRKGKPASEKEKAWFAKMKGVKIIKTQKRIEYELSQKGKPWSASRRLKHKNKNKALTEKQKANYIKQKGSTRKPRLKIPREINKCVNVERTIKLFKYDPRLLTTYSNKYIIKNCDTCNIEIQSKMQTSHKSKCASCTQKIAWTKRKG